MVKTAVLVGLVGAKLVLLICLLNHLWRYLRRKNLFELGHITRETLTENTRMFIKHMDKDNRLSRWLLKVHIRYIEQTQIKKYIKFFSINYLMMLVTIIFGMTYTLVYSKAHSLGLGIAIGLVVAFVPFILLDCLRQYNQQRIRNEIIHLFSLLGQWYAITEDIMQSFDKVSKHGLAQPLSGYVEEFVTQVHSGLEISLGLDILDRKVESDFFSVFIANIDQAIANRGDVGIMLRNLEDEAYRLQEEFNRRSMSLFHDRVIIYITMAIVLLISYRLLILNEVTEHFYFNTSFGQLLVILFCLMYISGFFIATTMSKLEY